MRKANVKTLEVAMRKANVKTRNLLERPIEVAMLPPYIPRAVAADFAVVSKRTLLRDEKAGKLTAIKRGTQSVYYERGEFLRYLGIR